MKFNVRPIIRIDENKCNGCGACVPGCHEGALQIVNGKAKLVSEMHCDGLGACLGHCPQGAILIEKREAEPYDERRVMEKITSQGEPAIWAHLQHLEEHGEWEYLQNAEKYLHERGIPLPAGQPVSSDADGLGGCPGMRVRPLKQAESSGSSSRAVSRLQNWPIQLRLAPIHAPFLKNAEVLLAADCTAFAAANFHEDFLKGRVLLIACPKLDDSSAYAEKLRAMIAANDIRSLTVLHMEVPCCYGLVEIARGAVAASGGTAGFAAMTLSLQGEKAGPAATSSCLR